MEFRTCAIEEGLKRGAVAGGDGGHQKNQFLLSIVHVRAPTDGGGGFAVKTGEIPLHRTIYRHYDIGDCARVTTRSDWNPFICLVGGPDNLS
ncbi:hypothetical protein [Bauldia litoralis]|uniref:hypothetical protein n=1 Tax=Bauldia litoralis TaxID=665467 RepID=UPI001FCD1B6C|nr:hypothetical protein [Bauldia litoralis]